MSLSRAGTQDRTRMGELEEDDTPTLQESHNL